MSNIGDRLKSLLEENGISSYQFSKRTGISQSILSRTINKNSKPNDDNTQAICNYFEVNEQWFLTGLGQKNVAKTKPDTITNKNGNLFTELPNGMYRIRVPLIPVMAYAQYISEHTDTEFIEALDNMEFHVDRVGRGNYVAFEIKGDSMDDGTISGTPDKSIALCRELGRQHWDSKFRSAPYGWIIVHKDTILCKDIIGQDNEKGTITCKSRNPSPEYSNFELNLNEVQQIFKIIKRTF